jgi:hypothetical protein
MATLQGVLDALTAQIRLAVPLAPAAGGFPFVCYSGWVTQDALRFEVAGQSGPASAGKVPGRAHITIYDLEIESNTTRFFPDWEDQPGAVVTLAVTNAPGVFTFSGTPVVGQNVAIALAGHPPLAYAVQPADAGPGNVAAAVAGLLNAASFRGVTASVSGPAVSVVGGSPTAAVGGTGTMAADYEQTAKQFLVSVWAPSDQARDAMSELIRGAFSQLWHLPLGDGFDGYLTYIKGRTWEPQFDAHVFRRDLTYLVEFSTVVSTPTTQIVGTGLTLTSAH